MASVATTCWTSPNESRHALCKVRTVLSERLAIGFPIFVVALLTGLSFWLDAVVSSAPPPDRASRHDPDFIVDNFVSTQSGPDGLLRHRLDARRMSHFLDDDSTLLEQPKLTHYTEKRLEVKATSDTALMSSDGEVITMTGNVRLTRAASADQSELVMRTSTLEVTPDKGFARTDQPVVIQNATSRTDAVGLEFDYNTRQLELLRDVRTSWQPPAGRPRTP